MSYASDLIKAAYVADFLERFLAPMLAYVGVATTAEETFGILLDTGCIAGPPDATQVTPKGWLILSGLLQVMGVIARTRIEALEMEVMPIQDDPSVP